MPVRARELSVNEWAVLAIVAEQPTHGFAISVLMAPEGEVGQIWALPRPLVYRAIETLKDEGLLKDRRVEPGSRGPNRTILTPTPAGRRRLRRWLRTPVEHVRDIRSYLMLKLLFLSRRDADPAPLLEAQLEHLRPLVRALDQKAREEQGFEATLATWRSESAEAVIRFLEATLAASGTPPRKDRSSPKSPLEQR